MFAIPRMIIIDVGSTTTKALLFEQQDGVWRYADRGAAPTTVEAPAEDVMIGVQQALQVLEQQSGLALVQQAPTGSSSPIAIATDLFLATSSAGGGLKIVVCGNLRRISALAAEKAAAGAGAILLDVFASDDGLNQFTRFERLRALSPDMFLLSGGFEGADLISFVVEMCDFIRSFKSKSRFDFQRPVPIIYAGASSGAEIIDDLLGEEFHVRIVPNLKPSFESENLNPAREAIHDVFIEHVMSNAPGYKALLELAHSRILPTPAAVGEILVRYAARRQANLLAVDIGGATTDVFSVVDGEFTRSVSANYGMSYSIGNVYAKAGYAQVKRWLTEPLTESEIMTIVGAKLFNPTTTPATQRDLEVEQALAREALRLAWQDYLTVVELKHMRSVIDPHLAPDREPVAIDSFKIIIGSGGVLSNVPDYDQAANILIDAFLPEGVVELLVDSVFMLPHLGAFSQIDEESALKILELDCLIPLGTLIAPGGSIKPGAPALTVEGSTSTGRPLQAVVIGGEVVRLPLGREERAQLRLTPHQGVTWRGERELEVRGGHSGIILDLRGRPPQSTAAGEGMR